MSELVQMTDSAAKRVAFLMAQEKQPALRISVVSGGCSGFQYDFAFDADVKDDDFVIEKDGAKVLIDGMSQLYMAGCEIDFVEDLVGASFKIKNPNASAACGCGTSFAV